jgi:hypothetical protein
MRKETPLFRILYNPFMPNTSARFSLIAALLTLVFFCIGFAPFLPMTALVCYPAAFLSGLFALFSGLRGLRQPASHWMAWTGILTGGLVILAVMVFTTLTVLLVPTLAQGLADFWQSLWP